MKHDIINKRYYFDKGSSKKFHGAASFVLSSRLFILPDGKVTICEQLYWNSHFIIGDVQRTNLKDIWQSQEALYLCNLSRQDIGQHNKCQACTHFEECFRYGNRCWNNITKAYGKKYWDYPDPRCILAPKKTNRLDHWKGPSLHCIKHSVIPNWGIVCSPIGGRILLVLSGFIIMY